MTFTTNDGRSPVSNELRPASVQARTLGHLDAAYVDWAAVVGGALVAVAIFTTLMVFGSAIGLSLTSADPTSGISAKLAGVAVALWAAWVAASSFAAGGFITGRLRHRIADASESEVEMRDGLHGLIAWALAALIGSAILTSAIGTPASVASRESSTTTQQVELTRMFRGERQPIDQSVRADASALLKSISGHREIGTDDRLLLSQMVSNRTGVPMNEAEARVQTATDALHSSVESVRRASVLAAFLLAASLAIGAAAAWIAAVVGGRHRDGGHAHSPMTSWGDNWNRNGRKGSLHG